MSVKRLNYGSWTFLCWRCNLPFSEGPMSWRKHQITAELILVQVSGAKPVIPELFQLMVELFSWFNRYITIIYWIDMTIAWERYCWCRTPKSWCFKSMFVFVFRCQITISDRHSGYDPLVTTPTGRSEDHGQGEGGQIEHWKLWGKWKVNMGRGVYVDMVIFLRRIGEIWTSETFDVDFLLWGFIVNGSSVAHVSVISKVKTDRRYLNLRSFFFH